MILGYVLLQGERTALWLPRRAISTPALHSRFTNLRSTVLAYEVLAP